MTAKTVEKSQGSGRLAALGATTVVAQPEFSGTPSTLLGDEVYQQLAAPFDSTFRDQRGGVDLEYITGEQCISRLNQVLGPAGWSFTVREHGVNAEADEVWVLGELALVLDGQAAVRQQFGSQRVKRNRASGTPLDVGFDLKGAATDALKKCASLIGVGLYLSRKEPAPTGGASADDDRGEPLCCESCQQELGEIRFRDGTAWLPAQLASLGRRKHGRVLCMDHYRQANEARRRAEQGPQDLAF